MARVFVEVERHLTLNRAESKTLISHGGMSLVAQRLTLFHSATRHCC